MLAKSGAPYAKARTWNGLVLTAGHIGRRGDGTIAPGIVAQTELALTNLEATLHEHGSNRSSILRTTVYLSDMALWSQMNEPYRQFFGEPFPARSTVAVGLPSGVLVEIDAIASAAVDAEVVG